MASTQIIQYRDYRDFPRIFLVRHRDRLFLFDCPFDEGTEDFSDVYHVYALPELTEADWDGSWESLADKAIESLAVIPISHVGFDPSKRRSIQTDLLDDLLTRAAEKRVSALPASR
ncbi:MAG: hypothetical protein L0Y71_14290 [Gemmataceae bacterium]|nr:hypothetical protein [Gemmataceae bacterium]